MRPNVQYGESNLETIELLPDKVRIPFQEGRTVQMRSVATRPVTQHDLEGSFLRPSMTIPSLEAQFQLNTVERGEELEQRCFFLPGKYDFTHPVAFRAVQRRVSPGEFRDALLGISSILDISTDWFTYHCSDGAFGGMGLENFLSNLETLSVVPDHFDEDRENSRRILYAGAYGVDECLILDVEMGGVKEKLNRVAINFLRDGTAVDERLYPALTAQFSVHKVKQFTPAVQRVTIKPKRPVMLTVGDRMVSKPDTDSEEVVTGLALENPLRDNDIYQLVLREAKAQVDAESIERIWSGPRSYRAAYARVATPHPRGEYHTYQLRELTLQRISGLIEGEDIWNIDIVAEVLNPR
jgi:hypothetical protein